jgi:uncharacterized protein (UPF0332 family)
MLSNKEIDLINFYIENAYNKLSDAKLLFNNSSYKTTSNCLYYSCFYIVTALLISHKVKNVKSHTGTQQMFSLYFIKTKKLSVWFSDFYSEQMHRRNEADYAIQVVITKDELEIDIPLAEKFIDEIKKIIDNC